MGQVQHFFLAHTPLLVADDDRDGHVLPFREKYSTYTAHFVR